MCDFKQSTNSVGLKVHPDKTKILSNQSTNKRKEVDINNIKVETLSACESQSGLYKPELTSRLYLLQHRHPLFNMVITPTLSYASGTWTLSKEHERMIQSTQRKMLRFIVQTKRKHKKQNRPSRNEEEIRRRKSKPQKLR